MLYEGFSLDFQYYTILAQYIGFVELTGAKTSVCGIDCGVEAAAALGTSHTALDNVCSRADENLAHARSNTDKNRIENKMNCK